MIRIDGKDIIIPTKIGGEMQFRKPLSNARVPIGLSYITSLQ